MFPEKIKIQREVHREKFTCEIFLGLKATRVAYAALNTD